MYIDIAHVIAWERHCKRSEAIQKCWYHIIKPALNVAEMIHPADNALTPPQPLRYSADA